MSCHMLLKFNSIQLFYWHIKGIFRRMSQLKVGLHLVQNGGQFHYIDVIMGVMAPQITSLTIVYSTVYSGADQRKHQSSASLAFMRGIHRRPVNSPHKTPVTRKLFPFDNVIMFQNHLAYLDASRAMPLSNFTPLPHFCFVWQNTLKL